MLLKQLNIINHLKDENDDSQDSQSKFNMKMDAAGGKCKSNESNCRWFFKKITFRSTNGDACSQGTPPVK